MDQTNIRNFCIIAHIDHGKSTLADRLLEVTNTVTQREMKSQLLDQMDLERERGITIKLQPVRMQYNSKGTDYTLNLIDTPGHVDFSYEVSRSLACCEGAILVVDASQGIEAQTLANVHLALEHNLVLIPVVNKIDLPSADREGTAHELMDAFGFAAEDILYASGKTGEGVEAILESVIKRVPAPTGKPESAPRALVFDSVYDTHRGVVSFVRMVDGELKTRDKIRFLGSETSAEVLEIGYFRPKFEPAPKLSSGEVGYIVSGLRDVAGARVGDTVAYGPKAQQTEILPGYRKVVPMVYATLFPVSADDYPKLRDAMERLKLSDAALEFEPEHVPTIGFGFRTGFLGLLHMDIVQERLSREYNLDLVLTAPSVAFRVLLSSGVEKPVRNPGEFPDPSTIETTYEPWMQTNVLIPEQYIGPVMELAQNRRAISKDITYLGKGRVDMSFEMPLSSIILDFYDRLKSATSGYGSLNYTLIEDRPGDMVKVDIVVATEQVDALSAIVHRGEAQALGKMLVANLKELIPRHQFEVAIQAAIGGKIIARETISALRKDVTGYLYGGDVTRKMKLLNKQKKGKARMKQIGRVEIPQEAFLAVLKK